MSVQKSGKELAFIKDLYIAPDWGERFGRLIDLHTKLPRKGRVLYLGAGTGAHALSLFESPQKNITFAFLDESEECLIIARAKALALGVEPEFHHQQLESLSFEDEEFDLVIADLSMVSPDRLSDIIAEIERVTTPGGVITIGVTTAGSYGEFFSLYWEGLQNAGVEERDLESLILARPTISRMEEMPVQNGFSDVKSWTSNEEFVFPSGREFIDSPLIANFLIDAWMENIESNDDKNTVINEIVRLIDEEQNGIDFVLTVKATVVTGKKPDAG